MSINKKQQTFKLHFLESHFKHYYLFKIPTGYSTDEIRANKSLPLKIFFQYQIIFLQNQINADTGKKS